MTRSKRNRQTQNRPPEVEEDRLLMVILAIFNLGSGGTTIMGAQEILPKLLAWPLGAAVQLMLFLLLSGAVVKQAWLKKWIAVLVFTGLSVYTSFFTYYGELAGEANEKQALDRAVQAHQRLVAEVYTPMKARLKELEGEAETLRVMAKQEEEIGIITGEIRCGDKCRLFTQQAIKKESEAKKFASMLEELRPKFEYEVEGLTPKDILNKDRQALAAVPAPERNNYPDLARDLYIDTELDISLLAPYFKVKRGEESAIASLAIAVLVDGMAIMLATAITIRRQRKPPMSILGDFVASVIDDFKSFVAKVKRAWQQASDSQREEQDRKTGPVERLRFRLRGKGSDFLSKFSNAIKETEPHIIDYDRLKKDENSDGFRRLIDQLKRRQRGWVKLNEEGKFEVTAKHYDAFITDWLSDEIERQSEEEEREEEENPREDKGGKRPTLKRYEEDYYYVEIRIPLKINSD